MLAQLTIDTGAIVRNVAALDALIGSAHVVPVMKANAYGHGLIEVGRALAGVHRIAVYELDEAIALRDAGIDTDLHVLGPVAPDTLDEAHARRIAITLWDGASYLHDVRRVATRRSSPFRVHAKIDTGVLRLGMSVTDAPARLDAYARASELELAGVFSHLAAAEELDSSFTSEQLTRFAEATTGVASSVERHIAASAAAMLWPQTRLDAVRAGIAIYGLWPSPQTERLMRERGFALESALSWRTEIVALHDVPAHTPVGYGCAYHTKRPSRIAVLPIGYAEGLPRNAGDAAFVLVDGRRCRIIGRVCMNMTFIDVTDAPRARTGSTVTIIGDDGAAYIGAEELAAATGTIAYEIVARLPAAIPRRYVASAASAAIASPMSIVPS